VKSKFLNEAKKELKEIERIYSAKQSHPALWVDWLVCRKDNTMQ
jgi:hypothetical protein